jgi:hypothetical protein
MLDLELADRLDAMKSRTGLSVAEQIRRAIKYWLESQEWPVARKKSHLGIDEGLT